MLAVNRNAFKRMLPLGGCRQIVTFVFKQNFRPILNYKRLCPCVCVSVCVSVTLDWIISDLNTPSQGSDTDINIQIPPARAVTLN